MFALVLVTLAAQAAPFLQPMIALVPPSGVVGDGSTPVTVHVVAWGKDGAPITEMELRPNAREGRTGPWSEVGDGVYTFSWTPPKAGEPVTDTLILKGKTPAKDLIHMKVPVPVQMEAPYALEAASVPGSLTAGATVVSTVTFTGGTWGGEIAMRTCGGKLDNPTAIEEGVHKARLVVSRQYQPRLGIVTATDGMGQLPTYGALVVPLHVPATERLEVSPYARVLLKLDGREYGPMKASSSGAVSVPVELSPGLGVAKQLTVADDGTITRGEHALDMEETQQICILPPPRSLPASPGTEAVVRVVVLEADGTPNPNAKPQITVSAGKVGEILPTRDGIFEASYTPPERAQTVTLEASHGSSAVQRDRVTLKITSPPEPGPRTTTSANPPTDLVVLAPDPVVLVGEEARLQVVALDAWGAPVPNVTIRLRHDATEGTLPETVETDRYGLATVSYTAGHDESFVSIHAQSGSAWGSVGIVTARERFEPVIPISGTRARTALEQSWRDALAPSE